MPIVLQDPGIGGGIAQALTGLSGGIADGLERRAQGRLQQQQQGALSAALSDTGLDLQTHSGQQDFLKRTTSAGVPIQESLGILDRAIKQQGLEKRQGFQIEDPEKLSGLFQRLGIEESTSKDYADLYGSLSQGGKTSFANMFIENMQRRQQGQQVQPIEAVDVEAETFQFPEVEMFQGLVPKEKVAREKELFNENAKDFQELKGKLKGLRDEEVRVGQLKRYNDSGKLPEGMGKLNINWSTGDIRIPALANAETQGFVKTVNDFTVKAKDTFGSRVTNFELASFMKRLPTLANSTEGRRLIIDQMQSMSELDKLYYDSLKEVYDNYGLRGIDSQKAEGIAEGLRSSEEENLKQRVANSISAQTVYEAKESVPAGKVVARSPSGEIIFIWSEKVGRAQEQGYEVL